MRWFLIVGLTIGLASGALAAPAGAATATAELRAMGRPMSANRASSSHLHVGTASSRQASATLTVLTAPTTPDLHFWAMQVWLLDARGRHIGGVHLGLQWHPAHPGSTAVSFGGYRIDGTELEGTASTLPSRSGNPNTRDFAWRAGTAYRLTITRVTAGWLGQVTDLSSGQVTDVHTLLVDAVRVSSMIVFSEVFARCDAPPSAVRWSDLGTTPVIATYQSFVDGGCTNTDQRIDGAGVVQRTNSRRRLAQGTVLGHGGATGTGAFVLA